MTTSVQHWPGRMVELADGKRVWLAEAPAAKRELVLFVHGMSGAVAALFREMVAETRNRGEDAGNSGRRDPVDAR